MMKLSKIAIIGLAMMLSLGMVSAQSVDNYVVGQTAEFDLTVQETVNPDHYYDDGEFTEYYVKDYIIEGDSDVEDESRVVYDGEWTQLEFEDSAVTDPEVEAEIDADYTQSFTFDNEQGGEYSAFLVMTEVEGEDQDLEGNWNETVTEVAETQYSWTVSEATAPEGPLAALVNFFDSVIDSITGLFTDATIGTPSVENPPSGPE